MTWDPKNSSASSWARSPPRARPWPSRASGHNRAASRSYPAKPATSNNRAPEFMSTPVPKHNNGDANLLNSAVLKRKNTRLDLRPDKGRQNVNAIACCNRPYQRKNNYEDRYRRKHQSERKISQDQYLMNQIDLIGTTIIPSQNRFQTLRCNKPLTVQYQP